MASVKWRTLPLFGTDDDGSRPTQSEGRRKERRALDLVLHLYWSAGIEAHALGSLALRTAYPDQQRTFLTLQRFEEQRKAIAAQALETIWGVRLPASPTRPEEDDGTGDADGRAA